MNSLNGESQAGPIETPHFQRAQVDFSLTPEQYLIIQHYLPKRYALIEHKNIKKGVVVASAVKLGPEEPQNVSRLSGNMENTDEIDGRTKRIRIKKVDKFLEDEPLKNRKGGQELSTEDEFAQCGFILAQLKKHKSSFPFLSPVDPKRDGVLNYFQVVKEPMDLSTIEANLATNAYSSPAQFHAHINKIWSNSYTFNEKGSLVHKLTLDMEKYYKNLLTSDNFKKAVKTEKIKARMEKERKNEEERDREREREREREERNKKGEFGNRDFMYDDPQ